MKALLTPLLTLVLALACQFAAAFPDKPVRVVVPWPPGGGSDTLSRLVSAEAQKILGQSILIDNRAGASGVIGTDHVARSAPDGYTLLWAINSHTTNHLLVKVAYDPLKDFASVTQIAASSYLLLVNPDFPAKTWPEFLAFVKAQPGKLSYASAGNGTLQHLGMEMLKREAGIDLVHVPYKGSGPAITDVMAGHVGITFEAASGTLEHVRAGKLRAIAVAMPQRIATLPGVPTFSEAGLDGFVVAGFTGLLAPADTPAEVIDKLNAAYTQALGVPAVRERMAAMGLQPKPTTPAEFSAFLAEQIPLNAKILQEAGVKVD
ncbi:MAG: tripartite tricarboxylate transporter substrate binding protein [Burkholderiaceae bacterium]